MGLTTVVVVGGYLVFWTLALSLLARRFLELRAGPMRLLLSGATGVAVAGLTAGGQVQARDRSPGFVLLFIGIGLLVAMGLLVLLELVTPIQLRARTVAAVRAYRRWRQRTKRYSQITRIAVRHGLSAHLSGRRNPSRQQRAELARRLRLALDEAGGAFVKLGQILSTRRDLLPDELVAELSQLQDRAAPVPWDEIRRLLATELGAPAGEVFAQVESAPLAAASIAQVHRARLHTGAQVVVKVRRPGIEEVVGRDLDIALRLANVLHRRTTWAGAIGVRELVQGFAVALNEELDFTIEARNLTSVAATTRSDVVAVPRTHPELSGPRVLVMDYLDGVSLDRAGSLSEQLGLDRGELARTLLHTLLNQIMIDGVFLVDPHPGNLLLLRDGRLGLLDFGSVGRLDSTMRALLQRIVIAIDAADPTALTDALVEIVDRPEDVDEDGLERAVGRFMALHLGPGLPVDVKLFTDLLLLVTRHGVAVPPEVAAVFRALATIEGTLTTLAPGFDIVAESRAFARAHAHQALVPDSLRAAVMTEAIKLLPLVRRLPRRLDRITSALEHGRLSTGVRPFADDRDRRVVTGSFSRRCSPSWPLLPASWRPSFSAPTADLRWQLVSTSTSYLATTCSSQVAC
ncbi:MAG TPA: AarF/UbiB family protein [Jiangellaceae bacterium]